MSNAERDFLDAYLENLKRKKEPDLPPDVFFSRFCIAEILKEKDLDIGQLDSGYTDGPLDGGADAIYFFVSGRLITDEVSIADFEGFEGLDMDLHFIQATTSPRFGKEQIRKFEDLSKDLLNLRNSIEAKKDIYNPDVRAAIGRFAADESLVRLYFGTRTTKQTTTALHSKANPVQHEPRALLSYADGACDLVRANTIAAVRQHPHREQPLLQRDCRVLKNGSDLRRKLALGVDALALPLALVLQEYNIVASAGRAGNAIGPALGNHVGKRSIGVSEENHRLLQGLDLLCFAVHEHNNSSSRLICQVYYHPNW